MQLGTHHLQYAVLTDFATKSLIQRVAQEVISTRYTAPLTRDVNP